MTDVLKAAALFGGLLVLDVTAMLYGHDSRDGFDHERLRRKQPD